MEATMAASPASSPAPQTQLAYSDLLTHAMPARVLSYSNESNKGKKTNKSNTSNGANAGGYGEFHYEHEPELEPQLEPEPEPLREPDHHLSTDAATATSTNGVAAEPLDDDAHRRNSIANGADADGADDGHTPPVASTETNGGMNGAGSAFTNDATIDGANGPYGANGTNYPVTPAPATPGPAAPAAGSTGHIELKVVDNNGNAVHFKVKKTTKFQKIFEAYASREGKTLSALRFMRDGDRLTGDMTPESEEMDQGDSIDAMVEQIGGFREQEEHREQVQVGETDDHTPNSESKVSENRGHCQCAHCAEFGDVAALDREQQRHEEHVADQLAGGPEQSQLEIGGHVTDAAGHPTQPLTNPDPCGFRGRGYWGGDDEIRVFAGFERVSVRSDRSDELAEFVMFLVMAMVLLLAIGSMLATVGIAVALVVVVGMMVLRAVGIMV